MVKLIGAGANRQKFEPGSTVASLLNMAVVKAALVTEVVVDGADLTVSV